MAQPTPHHTSTSSPEPYWLGRASDEQKRLLKQHSIWTRSIGYLLHPTVTSTLPPNARIADMGTGTGIWPIEMSHASPPTYSFHGFDISPEQFLPPDSLPPNVTLGHGDFLTPLPQELHGTFDLVNIRLIIISLGRVEVWQRVLRNVLALLKPGGAICWTEGDFLVARGFRGAGLESTAGHHLTRAQVQLNSTLSRRFGYSFPSFRGLFEDGGLQGVEEDVLSTDRDPSQRSEFTDLGIGAVFGGLRNLAKIREEGSWDEEEVERRRVSAVEDRESGAYLRWDIHIGVGFKAS
ncbi:S-adenosyl-L-methionine-dependent methyltransferase [Didymella exigua CBS 183.55]|uniref:S-adenosyl-L-methionine-dependent methyltransferase n=1 Tax=Didymella exigua CBS 183.55 TaxID=1150837 RepID=A0A6A5S0A0_9PLEO|nr:S-adenosyl-L-methionine-dependent methyltransferase [Didymella exigua CBS 183.55]KAF1934101.1 S-adenosyl-L-methionine-dependent methyltransferase [Didymella exigua CBS 183.55]